MGHRFARHRFASTGVFPPAITEVAGEAGLTILVVSDGNGHRVLAGPDNDPLTLARFDTEVRVAAELRTRFTFVETRASFGHPAFALVTRALQRQGGVDVSTLPFDGVAAPSAAPVAVRFGGFALWPEAVDVVLDEKGVRCPVCGSWLSPVSLHDGTCRCGQRIHGVRA